MKYRKKPVEIEAIQWDGLNSSEIREFAGAHIDMEIYDGGWQAGVIPPGAKVTIHTLEGDMTASKGDYIIKGVNGEFYPCKPDIFEKTYEEV